MAGLEFKSGLRTFLESKGIRFGMDPNEGDNELQKVMPANRFRRYIEATHARNVSDAANKGIYRAMATRAEANTLIAQQAELYLDTNAAVLNRDSPDQTDFPGYSSLWVALNYNHQSQGRQMRPDSLKISAFIGQPLYCQA